MVKFKKLFQLYMIMSDRKFSKWFKLVCSWSDIRHKFELCPEKSLYQEELILCNVLYASSDTIIALSWVYVTVLPIPIPILTRARVAHCLYKNSLTKLMFPSAGMIAPEMVWNHNPQDREITSAIEGKQLQAWFLHSFRGNGKPCGFAGKTLLQCVKRTHAPTK